MSDYLKDKYITFLTIQGKQLDALDSDIRAIMDDSVSSDGSVHIEYLIRYDGIGVIRKNYVEIKKCFDIAKKVDRVFINLKNKESHLSKGKNIQIKFDPSNANDCYLSVADDDEAWVEKQFKVLSSRLDKFKNKNSIVHSSIANLAIQLFGVLSGLFLSLIFAKLVAPGVRVQHSFFIMFVSAFLVFSNLWTFILFNINKARIKLWPFICFNKKPLGIVGQSIIGLIITSIVIWLATWAFYILKDVGGIITK